MIILRTIVYLLLIILVAFAIYIAKQEQPTKKKYRDF